MEKSKKTKTIQEGSLKSSASNHTLTTKSFNWVSSSTTDHIYFNDEWNGEYEN